jgi:DNA polymerase-1
MKRVLTKEILKDYQQKYKGIFDFMDEQTAKIKELGYIETLTGRRRYITPDEHTDHGLRAIAINTPIQGSSADIVKLGMYKVWESLKGTGAQLLLQVHDALLIECPIEKADEIYTTSKQILENVVQLDIPLKVTMKKGFTWGDMS